VGTDWIGGGVTDWTPDGRRLVVNVFGSGRLREIWTIDVTSNTATPVLAGPHRVRDGRLSPDGKWLAYVAEESDSPDVFVQRLAGGADRTIVASGGDQPVWRRDGRELYFVDDDLRLHAVTVERRGDAVPRVSAPTRLPVPPILKAHWGTEYDVSPDGQRFYFLTKNDTPPPRALQVTLNWRALLE
jgi:hypothetical protein